MMSHTSNFFSPPPPSSSSSSSSPQPGSSDRTIVAGTSSLSSSQATIRPTTSSMAAAAAVGAMPFYSPSPTSTTHPSLPQQQARGGPVGSAGSNAGGSAGGLAAGGLLQGGPVSGLRTPSNRKTIYDRNLNRSRGAELSKASFAYIFGEMVSYAQRKVTGVQDFERRLADRGYPIGLRLISLLTHRALPTSGSSSSSSSNNSSSSSSAGQRQTRILPLLQFLSTHLWRALFNRQADSLRQADGKANEYYLTDNEPLTGEFISVPKEMSMFNPGAFVAGIIEGCCDGLNMPAKVSAVNGDSKMWPGQTVWVIAFEEAVVRREEALARAEKGK